MLVPTRHGTSITNGYRYGFNGKEKDDELKGEGNSYDYGFRMQNSRIGRFLSVDPLTKSYPELTPYQFAGNSPIVAIDLDGLEPEYIIDKQGKLTEPVLKMLNELFLYDENMMRDVHFDKNPNLRKGVNAETLNSTRVATNPAGANGNDGNRWIRTLSHELKHVEQYKNSSSVIVFDFTYAIDKFFKGYKNTTIEKEGFSMGDIATDFAKKHNPDKILSNSILTSEQKTNRLLLEVNKYKFNKLQESKRNLDPDILNAQKEGDKKSLDKFKSLRDNYLTPMIEHLKDNIQSYYKKIEDETKKS